MQGFNTQTHRHADTHTHRQTHTHTHRDRQTDRQADRQTQTASQPGRQAGRQAGQTDRQTERDRERQRQTDRQTDRQTETETDRDRQRQTETDRDRHRETQRDTERHRETQRDTERHRETQRDTERHRETQRDTERHRETQRDAERHRETQTQARIGQHRSGQAGRVHGQSRAAGQGRAGQGRDGEIYRTGLDWSGQDKETEKHTPHCTHPQRELSVPKIADDSSMADAPWLVNISGDLSASEISSRHRRGPEADALPMLNRSGMFLVSSFMLGTGCWINHIPNQHLAVESENWTAAQLDSTVHVNTNGPGPYLTCRDM